LTFVAHFRIVLVIPLQHADALRIAILAAASPGGSFIFARIGIGHFAVVFAHIRADVVGDGVKAGKK